MKRTRLAIINKSSAENIAAIGKLLYFVTGYIEYNYKRYDLGIYIDRALGTAVMLLHPDALPEAVWKDIRGYAIGAKEALEL